MAQVVLDPEQMTLLSLLPSAGNAGVCNIPYITYLVLLFIVKISCLYMGVHVCVYTELGGGWQVSSSIAPTYFFRAGSLFHELEAQVSSATVEANKPQCLSVTVLLGAGDGQ